MLNRYLLPQHFWWQARPNVTKYRYVCLGKKWRQSYLFLSLFFRKHTHTHKQTHNRKKHTNSNTHERNHHPISISLLFQYQSFIMHWQRVWLKKSCQHLHLSDYDKKLRLLAIRNVLFISRYIRRSKARTLFIAYLQISKNKLNHFKNKHIYLHLLFVFAIQPSSAIHKLFVLILKNKTVENFKVIYLPWFISFFSFVFTNMATLKQIGPVKVICTCEVRKPLARFLRVARMEQMNSVH